MKRPFAATVWREGDWYVSQCLEVDIARRTARCHEDYQPAIGTDSDE